MTCAGCAYEAPADYAFCPRCGRRLSVVCPGCGAPGAPDFAFCPRCGTALAAAGPPPDGAGTGAKRPAPVSPTGVGPPHRAGPAPHADARDPAVRAPDAAESDRRLVTVVFADVSGFTALSEQLDPEEVRAFQDQLFAALSAPIEQYDGFVEKYVGDAIMAVFGAPVAHEDDPERALRAALDMRARMEDVDRQWRGRLGRATRLHVGIHTGPVVAGALGGPGRAAYAVTGDTVNTAARLQGAAEPGEILVSAATQRVTQHVFAFTARPPLALRGKSSPVAVYGLEGLRAAPARSRGLESHGLTAPLVGRDDELAQLRGAWERARRGRTQVVSLIGEAGQGKSRLVMEFVGALEPESRQGAVTVRRAACSSLGEQTYGVFAGFLREAYGIAPDDAVEVARDKLAHGLARLAGGEPTRLLDTVLGHILGVEGRPFDGAAPETVQRQIFGAIRTLVEHRLSEGPLVLAVEDLHWADAASVELLRHLVDRLPDRPFLVVVTYRPGFDAAALVGARATHTVIRLAPLSREDVQALLTAFFGRAVGDWPEALRALVVGRAGGNPLYLEEIVRSLITGGRLVRTEGGWTCDASCAEVQIPPTIHGLLAARLDRLPAPARRLLQEAAVLGPVFGATLLGRVTSAPDSLDAGLDTLLDAELIEERRVPGDPERRFRFAHGLLHEVAYENLLLRRRTELHTAIAEAIERDAGGEPQRLEDLEALAHHLSLGATRHRAAGYFLEAGDRARDVYANADAVRHYERALASLVECQARQTEILAVRERLGDLLGPMGRRDAALEHYEAVRAGGERSGRPADVARVLRKMGGLHWDAGDRPTALACFRAGLDLLEGEPDQIERAHLYQELGRAAFRSGDHHAALGWAERALEQAERLVQVPPSTDDASRDLASPGGASIRREAAAAVAHAYNTLGIALARIGRVDDAVAHIERSVAVATAHDLLAAAGRAYTNLGVVYAALDAARGIEACRRGLEIAQRIGDFGLQSRLYANLAVAYCALTDRCEQQGIDAARASIQLDRALDQRDHLAVPLIVLGQIHQCHGDPERALAYYREALAVAEETGEPQLLFPCYDGLATVHLDRGEEAEAEHFLIQAQAVCARAGLDPDGLIVLPFLT